MLLAFSQKQKLEVELVERVMTADGLRSSTSLITGATAWTLLRPEHGSHRLSRISPFGRGGRRQTSFARVEVLPAMSTSGSQAQILDLADVQLETMRGQGPGGQHRNKTESVVRARHLPTGLQAIASESRSQTENKRMALSVLNARLKTHLERADKLQLERLSGEPAQFGHRIRSYIMNPQVLVIDHRSKKKTPKLREVLAGELSLVRDTQ
jgi:peptide chain release factor 2